MSALTDAAFEIKGYARAVGRPGVRNRLLVFYTVNCCSFAAERIVKTLNADGHIADLVGNESCFDDQTVIDRALAFIGHPNVGAVLIVGHGCEFISADRLADYARSVYKPVSVVMTQPIGTEAAIEKGLNLARPLLAALKRAPDTSLSPRDLLIGVLGKGWDSPAAVCAMALENDLLSAGAGILREALYVNFEPATQAERVLANKNRDFRRVTGTPQPTGRPLSRSRAGVLRLGQSPKSPGLYLIDTVQDYEMEKGLAATESVSRAMDIICSGAQAVIFPSDGEIVCGTAVSPVFTIGAENSRMEADCARETEAPSRFIAVLNGQKSASEALGMYQSVLYASRRGKNRC